ncbi:MAG: hypothetical protein OEV63_06490 [Gammaproteobacteria bacterium]|nr:hypothetical protein [Gammaproteobacteria bacterium]
MPRSKLIVEPRIEISETVAAIRAEKPLSDEVNHDRQYHDPCQEQPEE